jgi:hypothetical protein
MRTVINVDNHGNSRSVEVCSATYKCHEDLRTTDSSTLGFSLDLLQNLDEEMTLPIQVARVATDVTA